jgi:type I restriction enzyme S subunit
MTPEIKHRIEKIRRGNVPDGYKKTKAGILPADWDVHMLGECLSRVEKPVEVKPNKLYTQIGIRSHGKGIFYKEPVTGAALGNKSVFWIEPDCFVVNIVFAWEQAIGKTTQSEVGMIGSHRFPMYRPVNDRVDIDYLISYFLTKRGTDILEAASPGGAGRNKTLGQERFLKSKIVLPPIGEQQKIAAILTTQDKVIELKEKRLAEKQRQKKYLMQQLLTGKKRLPGFIGKWKTFGFNEIFITISTKGHQINKAEYETKGRYPVIDQGRQMIAGYSNKAEKALMCPKEGVIVFGDHTREIKFVNFDFIVGADGTQLLSAKSKNAAIKYLFYYLSNKDIHSDGYSRHFKYVKEFTYRLPPLGEQTAIAEVLSTADHEIDLLQQDIEQEKQKKKALMQLLLTGIVRVKT